MLNERKTIPAARNCCGVAPATVVEDDFLKVQCPVCGRSVEVAPIDEVKLGHYLPIVPSERADAALEKWNSKEVANGR